MRTGVEVELTAGRRHLLVVDDFVDIRLDDPEFTPPPSGVAVKAPNVLVNQLGYLPAAAKLATLKTSAVCVASAATWTAMSNTPSPSGSVPVTM